MFSRRQMGCCTHQPHTFFEYLILPTENFADMKGIKIWPVLLLGLITVLVGCGSGTEALSPEAYFAQTEAAYEKADSLSKADLAFVTTPEVNVMEKKWGGLVAYVADKPAVVRLIGYDGEKWHFLVDTANGKVLYAKQEGDKTMNRVAYASDSVVLALAVNEPVQLPAGDAKANPAALNRMVEALISAIQTDRDDLDDIANKARKERAQFIVYGKDGTWTMVVNPSTRQVMFTENGKEPRRFAYGSPSQNGEGASVYAFNSTSSSLNVILTTARCEYRGRNLPYTITLKDGGRSLSGCGLLLQ